MTAATVFDTIRLEGGISSDRKLSALLNADPSMISSIRAGNRPFGNVLILAVHEEVGMSVKRIRELLASDEVVKLPRRSEIQARSRARQAKPEPAPIKPAPVKPTSFIHRCI